MRDFLLAQFFTRNQLGLFIELSDLAEPMEDNLRPMEDDLEVTGEDLRLMLRLMELKTTWD